ncbi:FMN-binding negative transcriptional regulator [Chitinophaga silvatica]|uniref:FMN-binding negative transcriptional regulator n=1 Tax=Chitinophaga silvatica TaxID=2282649 RepID=A0A3E1Y515_9BACT|nr:FMN-binding negative transcriptional regulator [Chitinophaga silvatica]RFS19722.1 FMN-binding negative transcriptional regulator [Chitinophaga silvatica]
MYIPKFAQETDWQVISNFIRENGFGILINTDESGVPHATHLPMTLKEKTPGKFVLEGHIAKVNPQWNYFSRAKALAIFSGAHSYISSSWYEKSKIPTWNYMAVHIHGAIRILEDEEVINGLRTLMEKYEAASEKPVHITDIDDKTLQNNVKAIVGFEIEVEEVNATYKLSQNKNTTDYNSVISHLKKSGDENALKVAAEMEARKTDKQQ